MATHDDATHRHALALLAAGETDRAVAERLLLPIDTVALWRRKARGRRFARLTGAQQERLRALLADGVSPAAAAGRLGIGTTTAYRWARQIAPGNLSSSDVRARPVSGWPATLAGNADALTREERLALGRLVNRLDGAVPTPADAAAFLDHRAAVLSSPVARRERKALVSALGKVQPEADWSALASPADPRGTSRQGRARTLSLPVEAWPAAWREAWRAAIDPGYSHPGDEVPLDPGPLAHWAPQVVRDTENILGLYLASRRRRGRLPAITPVGVQVWIDECRARGCRPRTLAAYVERLAAVAPVLAPDEDWRWLRRTRNYLTDAAARAPKQKWDTPPVDPGVLWAIGCDLTAQAATMSPGSRRAAARYRDGVLCQLLASAPVRLANMAAIEIGTHLVLPAEEPGKLVFEGGETKARTRSEHPLWPELRASIDTYLASYRPRLCDGTTPTDALWIALGGRRLTETGLAARVSRISARYLEQPVSPHRARDAAATALVLEHPEQPELATAMLQHRHPRSLADYTEHAGSIGGARALATASARACARVECNRAAK